MKEQEKKNNKQIKVKRYNDKSQKDSRPVNLKTNDAKWQLSPEIVSAAANLYFSEVSGLPILMHTGDSSGGIQFTTYLPGCMVIDVIPTIGNTIDNGSAVRVATRKLYSYVRHANSGHTNYEGADLMEYILAGRSLITIYSWMVRLYALLFTYNVRNRNYPNTVIKSLGITDAVRDYLLANPAQLRYAINMYVSKFNSLAFPKLPQYERDMWLNSQIYKDADSDKAQIVLFNCVRGFKFSSTKISTGGSLHLTDFTSALKDNSLDGETAYENFISDINSYLNVLLAEEDFGIMSGDILKAFGEDKLVKLNPIPDYMIISPIADVEVLTEIQNLTVAGTLTNLTSMPAATWTPYANHYGIISTTATSIFPNFASGILSNGDVIQADGELHQLLIRSGMTVRDIHALCMDKLLTTYSKNPSPEDVLVMTNFSIEPSYGSVIFFDDVGDYIVKEIYAGTPSVVGAYFSTSVSEHNVNTEGTASAALARSMTLSKWTCCPLLPAVSSSTAGTLVQLNQGCNYIGDVDNYCVVQRADLKRIHDASFIGLYGINRLY